MTVICTAAGTWARPHEGFPADVARVLTGDEWGRVLAEVMGEVSDFGWWALDYPASFGPVAGPHDAHSYNESVAIGVDRMFDFITSIPDDVVLCGYSQGGEVVGRTSMRLINSGLEDRCRAVVTFGDPTRQPTDQTIGGGKGWGISKLLIPPSRIRRRTYALPGDMYCTCPDGLTGDQMHSVYAALTALDLPLDRDLFGAIFSNAGLFHQVRRILEKPVSGGVALIDSLIRLASFAATNAHSMYGPYIGDAAEFIRSVGRA